MNRQDALVLARSNLFAVDVALSTVRAACLVLDANGAYDNGIKSALAALTAQRLTALCYVIDAEFKAGEITADEFYAKMDAAHNDGLRARAG